MSTIDTFVALQASLAATHGSFGDQVTQMRPQATRVETTAAAALGPAAKDAAPPGPGMIAGPSRVTGGEVAVRLRRQRARQSYVDQRLVALRSLEGALGEPTDRGLAADFWAFRQAWYELANHPDSSLVRSRAVDRAHALCSAFLAQTESIAAQRENLRGLWASLIGQANAAAEQLAGLNEVIAAVGGSDIDAALAAQRDEVAMRCADLAGARATLDVLGQAEVDINGVWLVAGAHAGRLVGADLPGRGLASDEPGSGVEDAYGVGRHVAFTGGRLGAVAEVLTHVLPAYMTDIGQVARLFADVVNTRHTLGFDACGRPGTELFGYDQTDAAGTLSVLLADPAKLAAAASAAQPLGAGNALAVAAASPAEISYQRLVGELGAQLDLAEQEATDQRRVTDQTSACFRQCADLSAVEQLATLRAHQRAFASAAVVLSTVETMLGELPADKAPMVGGSTQSGPKSRRMAAPEEGTCFGNVVPLRPLAATGRPQRQSNPSMPTVMTIRLQVLLAQQEQYLGNCADGAHWLARSARCLADARACLNDVRGLGRSDSGSRQPASRGQRHWLARQARRARADLLRIANTTHAGRPVFAGIAACAQAYDPGATYLGNVASIDRVVADDSILAVNVSGPDAFGQSPADVFTNLDRLASALRIDDAPAVAAGMRSLEADAQRLSAALADVQQREAIIATAAVAARVCQREVSARLARFRAVEQPLAPADLVLQGAAHQAGLAAADLVAQPSLVAYLR